MSPWADKKIPTPADKVAVGALLTEETILIAPPGMNKAQLLESAVLRLCDKKGLADPQAYLAKVQEREKGISTTLDTGLSLPHARIDGLTELVAALAVAPHGVPNPTNPSQAIKVMFLFLSPNTPEFFTRHLQLLRAVSTLFQPSFIQEIVNAPSAPAILKLILAREV